jgi:uncharacterized repeat protein (TIGR01451 family)
VVQNAAPGPKIWLQDSQPLSVTHVGPAAASMGLAQPLSMVSADFDRDGVQDLLVGYSTPGGGVLSLHRGNLDAFAPQSEASFQAIGRGEFSAPFLQDAQTFSISVRPDFIAVGNFTASGNIDLVVAARGGNALYVFPGDGKGHFGSPQVVNVTGGITALVAGDLGNARPFSNLVVGISTGGKSFLAIYGGGLHGPSPLAVFKLDGPPTAIAFGDLDGDARPDFAVLAGSTVSVYYGATAQLQPASLPITVSALALGSFIFDRDSREQMALLSPDGSIYIAAHDSFDPRGFSQAEWQQMRQATVNGLPNPLVPSPVSGEGWKIVESFAATAPFSGGALPLLFRTRISGNSADDVMVLNGVTGQLALVSHPNLVDGASTFTSGQVVTRPYSGSPVAALPIRVNVDGRPGVVAVHQGEVSPRFMGPLPDPTFTVDTTSDIINTGATPCASATAGQCSLRQAIFEANNVAGVDTIMVPAGTYTLTIADVAEKHDATTGELSITDGVNIIGAVDGGGNPTTIVQACTVNPGSAVGSTCAGAGGTGITEKPFSVNPLFNKAFDTAFTNLEIRFGHNTGTFGTDGFGGGFDWEATHTGNMAVTNCNIHDNAIEDGRGAGITATNTGGGTGTFTMSGSTVSNNVAQRKLTNSGTGGGIFFGTATRFTITNSHIDNNQAVNGADPEGAGIFIFNPGTTPISVIHGGTISGNGGSAVIRGGGIRTTAGITIDQGTVISGNTAQEGAGLWTNLGTSVPFPSGETTTLTKVTVTGNNASGSGGANPGGGGGIKVDNSASGNFFVMSFSRLAGNTATAGGSNLFTTNPGAQVTATNNWWGTNNAASTIGGGATVNCPTPGAGQICFDPFIVLTHTASPAKIKINGSSALTADMSLNSQGVAGALSGNLDEIVGLPITFDGATLGASVPETQPENLGNPVPTATATFNASTTSGLATVNATLEKGVTSLENYAVAVNTNLVASATESGTTATITTVGANGFSVGDFVSISGVTTGTTCTGYNGNFFKITAVTPPIQFSYTAPGGLTTCSGGTASTGIIILEPPSITKSFGPKTIQTTTGLGPGPKTSTITFSITNGNVVPIDSSFADTLPANLVVASTPKVVNNCGGTVTANAGAGSISFANPSTAAGTCTINVDVQSAVDGVYNNSVTIDSADAGNGNTSSDTLTVINPPSIGKVFGVATIPLNGTTSLTFTITNPNSNLALGAISFSDTLPTASPVGSLVVATPNGAGGTCLSVAGPVTTAGTLTAVAGSSSVSLSGLAMNATGSCTVTVNVQGTLAGQANNSVTANDATAGAGAPGTASIIIIGPPTISKSFSPKSVPLNSNSTLSFTLTNPNTASALSAVAFTDTLPGGVTLASTTVTGSCGSGTITATINNPPGTPSTVSLSGGTLTASPAAGSSCTFSVSVTGISAGAQVNTTSTVSSAEGGTGGTASDTLIVVAPPTISKSFSPKSVPLNSNSTLSFTVTNPNTASALSGVAFTDTLPGGIKLASTTVTGSCGSGTITATINNPPGTPSTVSLSGGTLTASPAAGSACTFSVSVTGISAGAQVNTTGTVSSTEGGTGGTATDTLTVVAPPTISKSFSPKTIALNSNSTLSFTVTNPNTVSALSGVAFTDSLPGGVTLASTTVTGSCGSGTITATINNPPGTPSTVSLSGGTLTASPDPASSCTFSVSVTGISAGAQVNTTGTVSSTEGGTGGTASDTLTVVAPPTIAKKFGHSTVPLNQSDTLSFTITNPNTTSALSGVAVTDTLPGGLKLASTTVTGSCGSGTITATINNPPGTPSTVSLSGGTLTASPAAGSSCTFSVSITGISAGAQVNTTSAVSSTEGGTGGTATDTITVVAAPTTTKVFTPNTIGVGGTSTMTITITNPSATVGMTGVGFTDNFPANLLVATPNGLTNTCNGTPAAAAGSGTVSLTGGTIAANSSCTVVVNVTSSVSGTYLNSTGPVSSTEGGNGAAATATLTVAQPPSITKAFNPTQIPLNGISTLTFNLANPNSNVAFTQLAFTDNLPAGLVVAPTPSGSNTCGGSFNPVAGAPSVSLTGGTLASSASCAVSVNVQGTVAGVKNNSVFATSNEGGQSTAANATITVVAPPTVAKAFGQGSVALNVATTTLSFTVANPNGVSLSGIGFTDNLPAGLQLTSTTVTGSCGSGTITAVIGPPSSVTLSGGTLGAGGSCMFSVTVKGTAAGIQNNTTGAITSTEGGTGGTSNTAPLNVDGPPVIAKAFNPTGIQPNSLSTLTITITNPAANPDPAAGVAFTDNLPSLGIGGNMTVATPNGLTNSCGGTATATAGSGTFSLSGGSIPVNSSCTVTVNVTATATGSYLNSTGAVSSTNGGTGNTASAALTVAFPPTIGKAFVPDHTVQNGTSLVSFTIANPNSNSTPPNNDVSLTGISFTDSLPAGLVVAAPGVISNDCGGTVTAAVGSGTITLTGGSLAPAVPLAPRRIRVSSAPLGPSAGSCFISVKVTSASTGTFNNTTGPISANESGPGAPSNTATLTVTPPPLAPTLVKAFGAVSIPLNGSTSLTFTLTNPGANSVVMTDISFSDTLPSGLVVSTPNGLTGTCTGSADITANAGSTAISMTSLSLNPAATCSFSINVTGVSAGTDSNTTGQVSAKFDDGTGTFVPITGGTASATLFVVAPPVIAKAFNPTAVTPGATSTLTLTLTNPPANTVSANGVAFTDTLPANLVVATPNGLSNVCGLNVTAVAGSGAISLTGGTLNTGQSCTVSVNVTSAVPSVYNNNVTISSTNGGTGNTASASLTVANANLAITKSHQGTFTRGQNGAQYTLSVSNTAGAGPTTGTVTVVDTLPMIANPHNLVPVSLAGTGWSCNLGTLTCTRSDVLAPGASYPAITFTVNIPQNITNHFTNTATVSGGGDPNSHTGADPVNLGPPLTITSADSGAAATPDGTPATFAFNVDATAASSPLGAITFSCGGLPTGAQCSFNPVSENQAFDTISLQIGTTPAPTHAVVTPFGFGDRPAVYAILVPMLGLAAIIVLPGRRRSNRKKSWLRPAFALGGMAVLLALAGCGGRPTHNIFTPLGTYTITVTASAGSTTASTNITLTVQ